MVCLAVLGLCIKMSLAYDDVPLIHVSVAFAGFTVGSTFLLSITGLTGKPLPFFLYQVGILTFKSR